MVGKDPQGKEVIQSCCLLTTGANELMMPTHDRMPVILDVQEQAVWLKPQSTTEELTSLLKPYVSDLQAYPVSTKVNNARYDAVDTIKPYPL